MTPFDADGSFHPTAGSHELRRLAVRGAAATFSASGLGLLIQTVSTVVLARLLSPSDFGVVTMATTFSLLLVNFGANGITEAIIQFEDIDHKTASNLFWFNSCAGLVLALSFASAGSLMASFYQNPLVAKVAVGLSVGIFVQAVSIIHLALLMRAMHFTGTSANDVVARIVYASVPIVMAIRGWGYWALVSSIVAQQLSITIGAWWRCRWVPGLPGRTGKTRAMLSYAAKVYTQFSVGYATRNVDNLLVGWQFNAIVLGFYKKAFDLFALTASQVTAPLNNVALAALSRLNQDQERFRRSLSSSLGTVAFVGMGMSADLSLVGREVVRLVLGAKWAESGRIFELFGPGIGAMLLYSTVGWVHLPIGKPGRWVRWSVSALAITVSLFLVALHWGPMGVAAAWSISYWVLLIPAFWYAGRPIGFGASLLIDAVWRYTAAALTAGLIAGAIFRHLELRQTASTAGGALESICVISIVFCVLYLAAVVVFHWGLKPLQQFAGLLRELAPSRRKVSPLTDQNTVEELK